MINAKCRCRSARAGRSSGAECRTLRRQRRLARTSTRFAFCDTREKWRATNGRQLTFFRCFSTWCARSDRGKPRTRPNPAAARKTNQSEESSNARCCRVDHTSTKRKRSTHPGHYKKIYTRVRGRIIQLHIPVLTLKKKIFLNFSLFVYRTNPNWTSRKFSSFFSSRFNYKNWICFRSISYQLLRMM